MCCTQSYPRNTAHYIVDIVKQVKVLHTPPVLYRPIKRLFVGSALLSLFAIAFDIVVCVRIGLHYAL